MKASVSTLAVALLLCGCANDVSTETAVSAAPAAATRQQAPTAQDADAFIARAEQELSEFSVLQARADWVNATYITDDTDALAAHFGALATEMNVRLATEAARYQNVPGLSYDTNRKLNLLRSGLVLPAPQTPGAAAELSKITTGLQSTYG